MEHIYKATQIVGESTMPITIKMMQIAFAISNAQFLFCSICILIIRGSLLQVSSSFIKPHSILKWTFKIPQ